MTRAYLSNISMYSYGPDSSFHGDIHIASDDGTSVKYSLNSEECEKIAAVCYDLANKRKTSLAKSIEQADFKPLLGYDSDKTIEVEAPPSPPYTEDTF